MIIYPIREPLQLRSSIGKPLAGRAEVIMDDGGAVQTLCSGMAALPSSSSSTSSSSVPETDENESFTTMSSFPLKVNYCPANPCITKAVHRLHKQVAFLVHLI